MNLKKIVAFFVLSVLFISTGFAFAEEGDLEIDQGKDLKFDFRHNNPWYDDTQFYNNVNIGAGTKVVLGGEWQYVFVSSQSRVDEVEREDQPGVYDEFHYSTCTYRLDENIATLTIKKDGNLILNAGSELSIRNQYSLVTSTQDVSLRYKRIDDETVALAGAGLSNMDTMVIYESEQDEYTQYYLNKKIKSNDVDLFEGLITFECGDSSTTLTFQKISGKVSEDYELPKASITKEEGETPTGGTVKYEYAVEDKSTDSPTEDSNIVTMTNDFQINSNRAVFNVVGERPEEGEWNETTRQVKLGKSNTDSILKGDGTIVKKGEATLNLVYKREYTHEGVDGMGLTGANNGYAWRIEEGMLVAHSQENLGEAGIYIDGKGTLGLSKYKSENVMTSPLTVISEVEAGTLKTNKYSNNITSYNGEISIASNSKLELTGDINTVGDGSNLRFTFYRFSSLSLSGTNNAENFIINFGAKEGGEANYLITDVAGLAVNSVVVKNATEDEEGLKEFAFFELVLNEDDDTEYSGSLQGEMYLHKLGTGTVILSGENTYTQGTYISEGGLLLSSSTSIGTGNIWFDRGTKGVPSTYASIGVVNKEGDDDGEDEDIQNIELVNNIHVKNGAILNVEEKQNLRILGDVVSYDARPGYETEFIKKGLGEATISGTLDANRQVNISTFTVEDGGFVLDKNIVLNSYFSLDGQKAYLKMNEAAGVKNNVVDINTGDLIIFNEKCISSATAVNFNNTSTVMDSFSKLHITSNTVLSDETLSTCSINIANNIEFVTDATTTAKLNKFNFAAGDNKVIVKSGTGTFIADNNSDPNAFVVKNLYINDGFFRLDNTIMNVSSETIVDGGILSVSSTSHFASTAASDEDKKITILDGGGIGIYNAVSIDSHTALNFEGTDENNLSRLVIEGDKVELGNNIYVKTGLIIENEKDFTFLGYSDKSTAGILAKAGAGTMTINSKGFTMKEIRALEGNLLVKSNITVDKVSILGENAFLSFENVNNANIKDTLSMGNGGTLTLSTSTVNVKNDISLAKSNIFINKGSKLNSANVNFDSSTINLTDVSSVIEATTIDLANYSKVKGYGTLNATVNVKDGSSVHIGSDGKAGEKLKVKDIVFESGSELYIDISGEDGLSTSDKLEVTGDITVQKNSTLHVNLGDIPQQSAKSNAKLAGSDSDELKEFAIITFSGGYSFDNTTNEIFNIELNDPRFSASTALIENSIFLKLAQEWSVYDIPGTTKNQQSMIDVFNKIYADTKTKENMKSVLSTLDAIYSDYRATGDKTQFINALQDLSGIFYANSFMTSAMLSKANIIYSRLNNFSKEREDGNNIWAHIYTNNFNVSANEENPKFENGMYGVIAGYDTINEDDFVFGIAGFYGQGELKQLDDKADIIDAGANVYGDYKINENINIKGLVGYSMQGYDTTRDLRFIKQKITSKYATNTISLDLEAAYRYDLSEKLSLKPLVGANCAVVSNGDIEEDGDTEQKLKIEKGTYTKAEVRVGVGLQSIYVSPFNWYVSAAVKQIVTGDKFTTKSSFVKAPDYEFEIESTKLASTSFAGAIGCSYDINSSINVSLDLNADTGAAAGFGANIGATYRW